jgi:GTPase SAR1 family protein
MNSPEVYLQTLTQRLLRLRRATSYLNTSDYDQNLFTLIRKSQIAQTLTNRYVIAITGSQGAGKTTFLRNLYELDHTWLVDNQGRGEKVPLLVIEKSGINAPEGWIEETDDSGKIQQHKISPEDFQKSLKGLNEKQILPILYVPRRYFKGESLGFVLLPGYEKQNLQNKDWQEMMRHTLIASSASIIVTDKTRLANTNQNEIIEDLKKHFLEGAKPIIVISKTENMPEDKLEELKHSAAELFAVGPDERERIICTGTGDYDYCEEWRHKTIDAIDQFSSISQESRNRQLNYLEDMLQNELGDSLGEIRSAMKQEEYSSDDSSFKDDLIGIFNSSKDDLRSKYLERINDALEIHCNKATKTAREKYIHEEEGFWNKVGNTKRWIMKSSGEREDIMLDRIKECWKHPYNEETGTQKGFEEVFRDILEILTIETLKLNRVDAKNELEDKSPKLLDYKSSKLEVSSMRLTEDVHKQIQSLFSTKNDNTLVETIETDAMKKELPVAIALLPVLALEFVRINSLYLSTDKLGIDGVVSPQINLQDAYKSAGNTFKDLMDTHSNVIKGIAAMLALDVAVDGKIDSLPALFNAASQALTGKALSASAGMIASAVVATGFIAYSVINEVQRHDAAHRSFIVAATGAMRDRYYEYYTSFFDNLMDRLAETLENRLMIRYKLNQSVGNKDNLARALAEVKSVRTDFLEAIRS